MHEAVVGKGQVGLPSICCNECPRTNMSPYYRDENVVISVIVLTRCSLVQHLLAATSPRTIRPLLYFLRRAPRSLLGCLGNEESVAAVPQDVKERK